MKQPVAHNLWFLTFSCFMFFMFAWGCKKGGTSPQVKIIPVNADLQAAFVFKPGSYWIYRDSVTGEIDSAYVSSLDSFNSGASCVGNVIYENQYKRVSIDVINTSRPQSGGVHDSERWNLLATVNILKSSFYSSTDSVEEGDMYTLTLYPFELGRLKLYSGCIYPPHADSGTIVNIFPSFSVGNMQFSNTALSVHSQMWNSYEPYHNYNDWFYLSAGAGIVKAVFNHPASSVYRVLELQRYSVVK